MQIIAQIPLMIQFSAFFPLEKQNGQAGRLVIQCQHCIRFIA